MRLFKRKETRASASASDAIVQRIINLSAGNNVEAEAAATATVEICSGLVQRGLQAARIMPTDLARMGLNGDVMGAIGRALARQGQCIFFIDRSMMGRVNGGGSMGYIRPVDSWDVTGSYRRETWQYDLTFTGPSRSTTIKGVGNGDVLHFRWAYDLRQPWIGVGPLQSATLDARLIGLISKALGDEFSTPQGYFLPIPKTGGQDESVEALRGDIKGADGGMLLVESMSDAWQAGGRGQVNTDWQPKRFGPTPAEQISELWAHTQRLIFGAFGIPASLFGDDSATNTRESWRTALFGLINPLALMIKQELSLKLKQDVTLDFGELQASDVQGRARSFKALVDGGIPVDEAKTLSGFTNG